MRRSPINILFFLLPLLICGSLFGQNSLQDQIKELDRLQARLESLQNANNDSSDFGNEKQTHIDHKSNNGRFQIVNIEYQSNVPNTNTITILKGPLKIDTATGETWRFVVNGYDEYWKKIGE